jgi:hypothetical protein
MGKKTYYLGYSRLKKEVIVYGSADHAKSSGLWTREVEAFDILTAKNKFLEMYRETHQEEE